MNQMDQSQKEVIRNYFKQANTPKGEVMEKKELNRSVVKEMREKFIDGKTCLEIAEEYAALGYVDAKGKPLTKDSVSYRIRFKKGQLGKLRKKRKLGAGVKVYTPRANKTPKVKTEKTADFMECFINSGIFTASQKIKFLSEMVK